MTDHRTPSELLACVLLGEHDAAAGAAKEMSVRGLWENGVRLAFLWRVVPQLRARSASLPVDMGNPAKASLASISAAAAAESAMVCRGAALALGRLEKAGIRAAAFKGLGMVASVYRSPGRRMLNDADVMVRKQDFPAATVALREAGFRPAISIGLEEWIKLLEERVYPAHDFMDFVDDAGVRIDVHWRLRTPVGAGFSIGEIIGRSVEVPLSAVTIRAVAPEDSILLTAHHLVRDRLAPRSAVKDVSDIRAWLDMVDQRWSLDSLGERARNAGLSVSVLAAFRILSSLEPDGFARAAAARIADGCDEKERKAAEKLARLFFLQLGGAAVSDIAVGMAAATPALAGRFIVSRLRSLVDASYRRNKFPGGQSTRPAAEIRAFLRDFFTLTPARFSLYRALAKETRRYLGPEDAAS